MISGRSPRARAKAKAVRGRRGRTPWLEGLEDRTVLTVQTLATVAADGVLTLTFPEGGGHLCVVSVENGEYRFFDYWTVDRFQLVSDAAGLVSSGSGTSDFRIRGITGINVEMIAGALVQFGSLDVPATIHVGPNGGGLSLGDLNSDGLAAITAPVVFESTADHLNDLAGSTLRLLDYRRSGDIDYTITSNSIAATGFGGVTYSGITRLEITGPTEPSPDLSLQFDVLSTPAGPTWLSGYGAQSAVFNIDATLGPDERPPSTNPAFTAARVAGYLELEHGTEYNIKRTPSPIWINSTQGDVSLTDDGSTAGITHEVTIGTMTSYESPWGGRILIDASADEVAQKAFLNANDRKAVITGATPVDIVMRPDFYGTLDYRAPRGQANALIVNLNGVSPLPDGPGMLSYDGGSSIANADAGDGPRLILIGDPILSEMHLVREYPSRLPGISYEAISPDSGGIKFGWGADWGADPRSLETVVFRGLAGGEFVDLVSSDAFTLWNRRAAGLDITIGAGPVVGGMQTLAISSPGFVTTWVANKGLIDFFLSPSFWGGAKTIDYASQTPVTGLEELRLPYDFNDGVVAVPPGATTSVGAAVPPTEPDYILYPNREYDVWEWAEGFPEGDSAAGGSAGTVTNEDGDSDSEPEAPTPPVDPTRPVDPKPPLDPTPTAPVSPTNDSGSPSGPTPPEVLVGGRTSLFGTAMRTTGAASGSGGSTRRAVLHALRAERLARMAALRAARAERLWHAAAHLRRAWPVG
ncbi:hypothetical protein [Paludisphaera rhizosphaerae]|uniref:hypothetical protein n=1 Tax=Paludisphaera rhizosphaerae TaxID=2711216 RepID=UPI0013ED6C5E|nr:hypothetical protein [Paludisphaera rhizosphaerae]